MKRAATCISSSIHGTGWSLLDFVLNPALNCTIWLHCLLLDTLFIWLLILICHGFIFCSCNSVIGGDIRTMLHKLWMCKEHRNFNPFVTWCTWCCQIPTFMLPFPYLFVTISLPLTIPFVIYYLISHDVTIFLPFCYHIPTFMLPCAFVVTRILPFCYHFPTFATSGATKVLPLLYHFFTMMLQYLPCLYRVTITLP